MENNNFSITKDLSIDRWKEYKELRINAVKLDSTAFGVLVEDEEKRTEQHWKDRMTGTGTIKMFFAECNGKLVGMIGTNTHTLLKIRHIGIITSFFVDPSMRQKGVGSALTQTALDYFKDLGYIKKIKLSVTTTQLPAIELYKKLGFEISGIEKCELIIDDKCFDQYSMFKFLD